MIINEAGEYTLQYTATDACGNSTTVERDLVVEAPPTYRTVLYTDGTFIINESSRDEAANVQAHGQPTNVYAPFDPNGATDADKYIFGSASSRPWNSQTASVISVEIGSNISPTSTANWFYGMSACTSIDLTNLDTSSVTDMFQIFRGCSSILSLDLSGINTSSVTRMEALFHSCGALTSLDLSAFDTSNVTSMQYMFFNCKALASVNLSSFDTRNVSNMDDLFYGCEALTAIDVSGFNTSSVTSMGSMFAYCSALTSLDLSNFDTSLVTNMTQMFNGCTSLVTIYASALFVTTNPSLASAKMFTNCTSLVGGAGTTFSTVYVDKTRAKIDGGTVDPGYFTARS